MFVALKALCYTKTPAIKQQNPVKISLIKAEPTLHIRAEESVPCSEAFIALKLKA